VASYHLDTDFLVTALATAGAERQQLRNLVDEGAELAISAVAWYEFCRGPRTPEQLAVARGFFGDRGILAFTELLAGRAAEVFRSLGSPRRRAADIAIGVTAVSRGAVLLTRNAVDFEGIPELQAEGGAG
jgi:predicted nucleic acid-binding protein